MSSQPRAKKLLYPKMNAVAAYAGVRLPFSENRRHAPMIARLMAIPAAPQIMSRRIPSLSSTERATSAAAKYTVPSQPVMKRERAGSNLKESSKTVVAPALLMLVGYMRGMATISVQRNCPRRNALQVTVCDQVDATNFLYCLSATGRRSAPKVHRPVVTEELLHRELLALDYGIQLVDLLDIATDLLVVRCGVVQIRHDLGGGFGLAVFEKPSRRFGEKQDAENQKDSAEGLEGDGKAVFRLASLHCFSLGAWKVNIPPLEGVILPHEPEAKVDPVADNDTSSDESTLKQYQEACDLRRRHLRLPDG